MCLFDGKDGSLLSSLTHIGLEISDHGRLRNLYFYYNNATEPIPYCRDRGVPPPEKFPIDGPKGERTKSVQMVTKDGVDWLTTSFVTCPTPISYKISTNFGRDVCSGRKDYFDVIPEGFSLHNVEITPETTPIGFYTTENWLGIISLGVL